MPAITLPLKEADERSHDQYRIIVIGASAGGFEALKTIVKDLPSDINASIFIVWHMATSMRGMLPDVFNNLGPMFAAHAYDREPIVSGRIYVAPPDHHMLVENGQVRVTRGPKENRFRPAVDPLFRSAAYVYGNRVIGVILSGALDDGTAGLWSVKHYGGIAVVQDPADAEVSSMPQSAMNKVEVDFSLPAAEMAGLLARLSAAELPPNNDMKDDNTKKEIKIAIEGSSLDMDVLSLGELSPFTCPECHGVLTRIKEGNISRFRCHTGHGFSMEALMSAITENIEENLYNAMRGDR